MKFKWFAALLAALCLMVAGCGGTKTVTVSSPVVAPPGQPRLTVDGHVCNPGNYAMQCALEDQQPPLQGSTFTAPFGVQYGVDGVGGGPTCSALKAAGYKFAASYWSFDAAKNWPLNTVSAYHSLGCGTVGVWETLANRALSGYAAGRSDATNAKSQASLAGNNRNVIFFAIDCDCVPNQTLSYFKGVQAVLGRSRTGAYGGYYQVGYLCRMGVVGPINWQTYAWSAGQWLPPSCAPLEQWSNDHVVAGHSVDLDRALLPNYGQWPVKSIPKKDPFAFYVKRRFTLAHGIKASEYNTARTYRRAKCSKPERRQVCKTSNYHARLLADRDYFVATHHIVRGHWRPLKKPRWGYPNHQQPLGSRYRGLSAIGRR